MDDEFIELNIGEDDFGEMPSCITCEYFIDGGTCQAFPAGIPDPILIGDIYHTIPYPGDNGIVYKQLKQDNNP